MTFRSLALSSIRGNWRAYGAFFLSSVFSVLVFYMYGAFLFHPDVINGHIEQAEKVRRGMEACEYIVVVFSFFFVLYANSAFLKTRKKEFGLYALFGMTRPQLRRMLMLESLFIALLAIAVGIGIGILLSKLFFMAMALLLGVENPIRFSVPVKAVLLTVGGFLLLFNALNWIGALRVGRTEIVDLLKEASKPKKEPAFSIWLALLGLTTLAGGYTLATFMNLGTFLMLTLPILFLVLVGTYFLFTQSSVAILRLLKRNKGIFYNRTNMIALAQMAFKLKDNARILFMVTILSAVIMTASGTLYVFKENGRAQLMSHAPHTIGYVEKGLDVHEVIEPDKLRQILLADGRKIAYEIKVAGIATEATRGAKGGAFRSGVGEINAAVIGISEYNRAAALTGRDQATVGEGKAFLVYPYVEMKDTGLYKGKAIEAKLNGIWTTFDLEPTRAGAVLTPVGIYTYLLVVDDKTYESQLSRTPPEKRVVSYGVELEQWEDALSTMVKVKAAIPEEMRNQAMTNRVEGYLSIKETSSLTLFVGLFVSLLFFIASGSMLYFKMYTEMKDDEAQFRALTRIGMTAGEIRRVVMAQVSVIFYVPVAVGILHTLFAMKALDNLLSGRIYLYVGIVIAIYIIMQSVYFMVAYRTYMNNMLKAAV
ncbi:FtsX-like permease family protein [Paenibacillus methanolicus]|uniref:Putative ABC transport system permease protein n=1 Tax=Paenibacillus methanolicus TaxID=582686 RepID=A0A5S5BWG2_9BACL|nr:ABC transporter permease [Paenibacillus methanolicus]TYP71319.1 putative ABC transport system permease protein [Paenibacillus methanolicus]